MRISIGQITTLVIILFLLFGDFQNLKRRILARLKQLNSYLKEKNRKKGT